MPLSDIAIRNFKAEPKPYKKTDEKGMYVYVTATGKSFRYDYRFNGKRKTKSFGLYPDIKLKEAREMRDDFRAILAKGLDPMTVEKSDKAAQVEAASYTFESIGLEWFAIFKIGKSESHADRTLRRLQRDIFPWLGNLPIAHISIRQIKTCLDRIVERNALETAHRALHNCGQIFKYGMITGRLSTDPTIALRGMLPVPKVVHHPSITDPTAIGGLLRAIDGYAGSFVTQCALKLAPLVFVRPAELRKAEWTEINLETAEWRIPETRMKMREVHIVPLSAQAVLILRELHSLTGSKNYVFPGARTNGRPMSENTVNGALRNLGYSKQEMTGHGFRSMASTTLNEQGWNRDAIERQLAHAERNNVRAAYNYAEHLPERRKMMQAWADHLDKLRLGAEVISINTKIA